MIPLVVIFSAAAFCATFLGGLFALFLKDKLHLVLGFSAGAVIGVSLFDLLPEAIELGQQNGSLSVTMYAVAGGFFLYLLLDRILFLHVHEWGHEGHHDHSHVRGSVGAASLSLHSLLDGVALGLAFQVSPEIGIGVAAAVLAHDFSDGINTVNMVLRNRGSGWRARSWLFVDACAPVVGALGASMFTIPEKFLGIILALFAGFFLYIGASDLIPESHHGHPKLLTTLITIAGALTILIAVRVAGF